MSLEGRSAVTLVSILCLAALSAVLFRLLPVRGTPVSSGASLQATAPALAPPPPPQVQPRRPGASELRAAAIRDTIEALREECRRCAGGDWDRWSDQLGPYRTDLKERIRAAKPYNPTAPGTFEARSAVLEGRGDFPLFEAAPDYYLLHVVEPGSLDAFRKDRPVIAGARWLERRGIDVIFVPVPKMTEVYPESFAAPCPSDRIVAPHVRRILLELLESGVEVVDLLPAYLEEREKDPIPLYQPADPHWAPRAQAIAARAIAGRLRRYDFVTEALQGPAICEAFEAPYPPAGDGAAFEALNPDQRRRAERSQPRTFPSSRNWTRPPLDAASPVAFIGDSYNGGLMEMVSREINLPVRALAGGGHTTHAFKDFLRDPDLLKDCKVVIWLVCNSSLKSPWPLPLSISAAAAPVAADEPRAIDPGVVPVELDEVKTKAQATTGHK